MKEAGRRLWEAAWARLNSLGGRTFVLLTIGITGAAVLSLTLTEMSRLRDFEALRINQLVARSVEIEQKISAAPTEAGKADVMRQMLGVRMHESPPPFRRDQALEAKLAEAMGTDSKPMAGPAARSACFPADADGRATTTTKIGNGFELVLDCWVVSVVPPGDVRRAFAMFQPPVIMPVGSSSNPIYLFVLLASSALLSILVTRFVTLPLRRLSDAATAFAASLDAPAADARGPTEVKAALSTFNIMQARVRAGLRDRTQLLAAISHDLQTPLTRLRLRLENVEDDALRDRLVADVNATQALVRQGLELARSQETTEPWSVVDIDSLVESLAEDAAEFGADVRFTAGCGASVKVRPTGLARALNNLIDNGVKYGERVEISCQIEKDQILIRVRDHGSGLSDPDIDRLFEPFIRGGAATASAYRGTGIGLTIARALLEGSGASIRLLNHVTGGLVAEVSLPRGKG